MWLCTIVSSRVTHVVLPQPDESNLRIETKETYWSLFREFGWLGQRKRYFYSYYYEIWVVYPSKTPKLLCYVDFVNLVTWSFICLLHSLIITLLISIRYQYFMTWRPYIEQFLNGTQPFFLHNLFSLKITFTIGFRENPLHLSLKVIVINTLGDFLKGSFPTILNTYIHIHIYTKVIMKFLRGGEFSNNGKKEVLIFCHPKLDLETRSVPLVTWRVHC